MESSSLIVVTHQAGARFAIQMRSHTILVDQPAGKGTDQGPMPLELLGASLGSCVAYYIHEACVARGISTTDLRVEVEQQTATKPYRVASFTVRVSLPTTVSDEQREVLERVARNCPAHHTLLHGAGIDMELRFAEPALAR